MSKLKLVVFLSYFLVYSNIALAQGTAQNLFSQYGSALYQIQMIDLESDNKSSIGSGFQITSDGQIITNFHVVSEYINAPDKYRIQYMDHNGQFGELALVNFDVVNDLALLKLVKVPENALHFNIAQSLPEQGSTIYSLGNPHDLGMIVVPGTYNGQKKKSYHKRIHFTGSINPGMSGGPAVNEQGDVVGVNVATAGNQIGFLVPLPKVQALSQSSIKLDNSEYKNQIQLQLLANQRVLMEQLLQQEWQTNSLAGATVPENIANFISCWGSSNADDKQTKILSVQNRCRLGEAIFISNHLNTGEVEIEFEWLSTQELGSIRFYNFLSAHTGNARAGNKGSEDDFSNYKCHHDIVQNRHNLTQKTVLCARNYKAFEQLFDVLFIATTSDKEQRALVSHFTLSGVTKESAQAFTTQFLDSVSWQ